MPTTIDSAGITFNDATSFTSAVLAANSVGATQITNGSVTASKLGTTEQKQICKAWVNFNGTTSPGTIRSSYNVSSVTKNGTGDYTVNFSTAMTDANYVLAGTNSFALNTNGSSGAILAPYIKLTSSIQIRTNVVNTAQDSQMVDVAIFGN
jgi:hypothetical protein